MSYTDITAGIVAELQTLYSDYDIRGGSFDSIKSFLLEKSIGQKLNMFVAYHGLDVEFDYTNGASKYVLDYSIYISTDVALKKVEKLFNDLVTENLSFTSDTYGVAYMRPKALEVINDDVVDIYQIKLTGDVFL